MVRRAPLTGSGAAPVSWLEVSLGASASEAEPVSDALQQLGASAVTISPRDGAEILEPAPGAQPLARSNTVTGLFQGDAEPQTLLDGLRRVLGDARVRDVRLEKLEDARWEDAWRQSATYRCYGDGLWVIPHEQSPPADARAVVRLDPGLAFGTGAHPTTALCLTWLASLSLSGRSVIDFGCGSGVLAIAAAVLGAAQVHAVDHDPQALSACRENAGRNGVADRIRSNGDPPPCDVLVANILANALDELAPRFAELSRPGGLLALSGILPEQAHALSRRYAHWFALDEPVQADGWLLLSGRRRD